MSTNAAVIQFVQRQRRFRLLMLLLLLLLITVAIVVVVVVVRRRRAETKVDGFVKEKEITLAEAKSKLAKDAKELGISPEELETALTEEVEKDKKRCMITPLPNGLCGAGYYLENDCCYPLDAVRNKQHEKLVLAGGIIKDVGMSIAAGVIIESILYRAATSSAYRASLATARATAWQGVKAAVTAARTTRAVVAAGRVAAATGKYAVAAAGGPPGMIIAGALLAFDAISITLDVLDVDGYDSFTSQGILTNMRNVIDYSMASEFEKNDMDYPMIFPISTIFPAEMKLAQEHMSTQIVGKYLKSEMAKKPNVQTVFDKYIDDVIKNPDVEPPIPKEFTDFIIELYKIKHLERDKILYAKLKELLGDRANKIAFYESISSRDRMGISLTREAAQEWNSKNEKTWMENNSLGDPPKKEDAEKIDKPAACYTDTYYVYQSGTADKPNMVAKKLPEKTVIANYYGPLLAYCEKIRKKKSSSTGVDPKALGTRFNFDTGVCEFSKELCERYGLEFKNNDCKPSPGQDAAELIFGKTITRAYIKEYRQRLDDFKSGDPGKIAVAGLKTQLDLFTFGTGSVILAEGMKSYAKKSDPATIGDCPPGMRADAYSCWLDPVYRGPGKPLGCKDDEEKKGQLCYPECRDDYESKNLECEGKCPAGSKDMGLTCLQSIHAYIPPQKCKTKSVKDFFNNLVKKCFWEPEPCDVREVPADSYLGKKLDEAGISRKYIKRGTTCNEPCLPGFTFRSGAAGSAFCDKPRNRYSRAGQAKPLSSCPGGYEKQGLLCYKKCSDKGPEGQYKYKGVLDWCQPEGGAGIKKSRLECPEGMERKGLRCYKSCKEGERDDGLFCKRMD
jgi:hypothetical protein